MHPSDEEKLKRSLSFWRQTAAGTWIVIVGLWGLYALGEAHMPVFGYIPWKDGPRMTFESEVACWRHLSIAKKTNEFLLDKDCTAEKEK